MSIKYIDCPNLKENKFISFYTNINNKSFKFSFRWNEFCKCCFLSVFDSLGNQITTGNALTNKTRILTDKRILPHLVFIHKNMKNVEPTPSTLSDYRIIYEDTAAK
jgi:hypothetical protein